MPFIFEVKVIPGSGKNDWSIDKSGHLKCRVKNQAESGKANAELIKSLSQALGVPQYMISIISGEQARKKRIKIDVEMTFNRLLELLNIEWQTDMF